MSFFVDVAFPWVQAREGKLSTDPNDPGNWTGGRVGVGVLLGTKYGISAAAYPKLDIPNLSYDGAAAIAQADYWKSIQGDGLPQPIALCVFDFAYNSGVSEAARTLQISLDVLPADGVIGPQTLAAAQCIDPQTGARQFTAARIAAYEKMDNYDRFGAGWVSRARSTLAKALSL